AVARGDHVIFVDADDYLHPDALETMLAAWQPGVAQVQARLDLVDPDGRAYDIFPPPESPLAQGDVRPLLARCGRYATTVTTGLAFTRQALEAVMP
ncbi:glycosyltransferase, partial [Mycobacterium tuberculosis]